VKSGETYRESGENKENENELGYHRPPWGLMRSLATSLATSRHLRLFTYFHPY